MAAPSVTSDTPPSSQAHPNTTYVDLILGMERIESVYSPPWAEPLPVSTIIPPKSNAVAILNEFLADPSFSASTWFTDSSLLEGSAGGAAVRMERGIVQERLLIPLGDGQVAEGEVEGLVEAARVVGGEGLGGFLVVLLVLREVRCSTQPWDLLGALEAGLQGS